MKIDNHIASYGPWIADSEGTIKRQMFDEFDDHQGYQLLTGDYPESWAFAPELLEALRDITAEIAAGVINGHCVARAQWLLARLDQ